MRPDPRHMLVHEGLAGVDLEGVVRAEWFVAPAIKAVTAPWLALHKAPAANAEQVSQLLFGERFDVLTEQDGFAFGQGARDGYVGWAAAEGLGAPGPPPTHWVSAPMTVILSEPRVRSAAVGSYPFGALVTANGREGSFTRIEGAGWAPARHLNNVGHTLGDWAATAELFLGAPYLWGGRTASGLDCSALTQLSLLAAGIACPRDSDQQARMGVAVEAGDLRRGDLVVWEGHVGMMLEAARLIHANGFHMAVAVEPLATALPRIAADGTGDPIAFRRPG